MFFAAENALVGAELRALCRKQQRAKGIETEGAYSHMQCTNRQFIQGWNLDLIGSQKIFMTILDQARHTSVML